MIWSCTFLHLTLHYIPVLVNSEREKTMSKLTTLCAIALLLFSFMLSHATARPGPTLTVNSLPKTQLQEFEVEVSCEEVGKEECLTRRTLAAHMDYIYTQNHKP